MARVVHLTSVHVPFDIRIFHKECKTLVKAGHEVVLIVPRPKCKTREEIDGVTLRAIPYPINRRERMTTTILRVYKAALQERADIYHFHDPELMPIAMLLKLQGKRVIYDVHEDVPRQILAKHWIKPQLRRGVARAVETIENVGSRVWDGISAATPTIAKRFPAKKTALVQNFPMPEELIPANPIPFTKREPLVVYVGKIVDVRGAKEMVEAMGALPESVPARLAMAGTFEPASLQAELKALAGWKRVDHLGWQTRPQVGSLLARARVGLVVLHPIDNYLEAQSTKLFEYMAAGVPIVASDFPAWRAMIGEFDCGLLVDPLNPAAIAEATRWLLEHPEEAEAMGKRGQRAVQERFTWDVEGQRLVQLYERILGSSAAASAS